MEEEQYADINQDYSGNERIEKAKSILARRERAKQILSQREPSQTQQQMYPSLGESIKAFPSSLAEYGKRVYEEAPDFANQPSSRVFKKTGQSVAEGARGLLNFLTGSTAQEEYRKSHPMPEFKNDKERKLFESLYNEMRLPGIPEKNIGKQLGVEDYQKGDVISESLPYLLAPELINKKGLSLIPRVTARGTEGAVYGASADTGNKTNAAILSALLPMAGETPQILKGIKGSYKGATVGLPAKFLRGTASVPELQSNLAIAGDLPLNIGKVTESPIVNKFYENMLAEMPFTGSSEAYSKIGKSVQSDAENLLSELVENPISGDPNDLTKEVITKANKRATQIKNDFYNNVSEIAEKEGHKLELPTFKSLTKENEGILKDSPLLTSDPKIKSFLSKLGILKETDKINKSSIVDKYGKPFEETIPPTIRDANITANTLYSEGKKMAKNISSASERMIGNKYLQLAKSLRGDVEESISKTGSEELKNAHDVAKNNYKENYAKFLDKDLWRFIDPDKSADSIVSDIVNPSKRKDKHTNIEKIQSLLPESHKNLLGYTYLQNAINKDNKLTPQALTSKINELGRRQLEALFPDEKIRNKLSSFQKLGGMSSEALNMMANQATGKRALTKTMFAIESIAAALGAVAGGAPGGAVGLMAPIAGAAGLARYLTNPNVRKKLVTEMIRQSTKGKKGIDPTMLSRMLENVGKNPERREER